MHRLIVLATLLMFGTQYVYAKECWALTQLKGQMAASTESYAFEADKFTNPMVLCFIDERTGTVSSDDTQFSRFGSSTIIGWTQNKGIELVESYQIDRINGRVLFIKSRIGTSTVIPGGPDIVAAFVGKAAKLNE